MFFFLLKFVQMTNLFLFLVFHFLLSGRAQFQIFRATSLSDCSHETRTHVPNLWLWRGLKMISKSHDFLQNAVQNQPFALKWK
jgi:hypothetical protein